MDQSTYIHGADENQEQTRLELQATLIKQFIWQDVSLKNFKVAREFPFLEVGCGVAAQTVDLLELLPNGAHVIGIDIDSSQISKAKQKMKMLSKYEDKFSFKVMDGVKLDFPNNSLSGAYISWVLEHMTSDNALKLLKNLM